MKCQILFSQKKKERKSCLRICRFSALTLTASITTAADDILVNFFFFFLFFRMNKTWHFWIRLDISCELSAKQTIHMNCQSYFLRKKKKKEKCCLLLGALSIFILCFSRNKTWHFWSFVSTLSEMKIRKILFIYLSHAKEQSGHMQ